MIFGAACGAVYAFYNGRVLGRFVRRLKDSGKHTAENSASLAELGYGKAAAFILSLSLGSNTSLRKYVKAQFTDEEMEIYREKGLPQKYYLPEENCEIALKRYNDEKMSLAKLLLGLLACVVAAVLAINVFPYLLSMFNDLVK